MTMPAQPPLDQIGYSTTEAAAKLGLNPVTVQRWIRRGRIRAMKVGGPIGYRIPAGEINRLLNTLSSSRSDELREIAFKINDLAGLALVHMNDLQELGIEGQSHASEMSALRSAAGLLEEVASKLAEEAGAVDVSPTSTSRQWVRSATGDAGFGSRAPRGAYPLSNIL